MKRICETYPQTMIYPVSVLSKSFTTDRKKAAEELIDVMKKTAPKLIYQALEISDELIRGAVLFSESWCEAIEEASRIYFSGNDADKMIQFLKPMYTTLYENPRTMNEISFHQGFKSDLLEAWDWCMRYKQTPKHRKFRRKGDINKAWDIYLSVFKKLSKRLKEI